jgi:hypothetical protein
MTVPDDASSSATTRRRAHRDRLPSNPWNRTRRGIICVPRALRFKARRAAQNRHMSMDYSCTERGDAHIQILTAFLAGGGLISGFDYGITKGARLQATASCFGHQTWWWFGCWGTARRVRTVHNTLRHRAITGRCVRIRCLHSTMALGGYAQSGMSGRTEANCACLWCVHWF